jgi:hypothetical protein
MYKESEKYTELASEVIRTTSGMEWLEEKRIAYLSCDKAKKQGYKKILGQCIKVREIDKVFVKADFYIVIYEPNCEGFTDEQYKILLEHELLHIGARGNIMNHDLEDFKQIVDKYGTDWARVEVIE